MCPIRLAVRWRIAGSDPAGPPGPTPPAPGNDKQMSSDTAAGKTGYKSFLGTPSGNIRQYDPKTEADTLIGNK
jgi:hypothetical protein